MAVDDEWVSFGVGQDCDIAMLARVHKEFVRIKTPIAKATLERHLKTYASGGRLLEAHFRFEGKFPLGNGKEISVFAFKGKHVRVYGCRIIKNGKAVFLCTEIDCNKKQDGADQSMLARAAKNTVNYVK